jgi:multiple antibiotic resistance protein
MNFFSAVTILFLVLDPLGLVPIVHGLLGGYEIKERLKIMIRESLFALAILMIFLLAGNWLLNLLGLGCASLNISGGILLFMVALGMVFPDKAVMGSSNRGEGKRSEPFIVPIAVPLMSGPSSIAIILVQSSLATDFWSMATLCGAVFVAWFFAALILCLSQFLMRFLGNRAMIAMERLMGMILILISVQMFLDGLHDYSVEDAQQQVKIEQTLNVADAE